MSTASLNSLPAWSDIAVEEVRSFRRIAFDRQFRSGTVLARAGMATAGAWLLVGGEVELILETRQCGMVIDRLTPGTWINSGCLVDGGPATFTAVAIGEVQAWLLTADGYRHMASQPGALARRALRQLIQASVHDAAQLSGVVARVQELTTRLNRPLDAEDLFRLGFSRLVLGPPVGTVGRPAPGSGA